MPAFLVSYNAAASQDHEDFAAAMAALKGVSIGGLLWGVDIKATEQELREWLMCKIGSDAPIRLLELQPTSSNRDTYMSDEAVEWFEDVLQLRQTGLRKRGPVQLKWHDLKRKTILG